MDITILGTTGTVFSRREARAHGIDGRALTKMVRTSHISRVGNGIYRIGVTDLPDPRAVSRATNSVVSRRSAAAWLGGDIPFPSDALELTAPRNRGRRADSMPGVHLSRADLGPDDVLVVRGVRVTAPVRTLRDLAQSLPMNQAVAIGDSLCRRAGMTPEEALNAALRLPHGTGRPSAVQAATLLDHRAESVLESITRVDMALAGLPPPTPQFNVFSRAGVWIARVDFAWEERRVILECDGHEFHHDRAAFQRDRRRWSALIRAGWRVVIVTWHDVVSDPAYLIELMTEMLEVA